MNKTLSSHEISQILLNLNKLTILSNSINHDDSFENLISTIKKSSNLSIIIEITKDKTYYIYDSYNNLWVETNNISFYNFQVTHSYDCNNSDIFNIKLSLSFHYS